MTDPLQRIAQPPDGSGTEGTLFEPPSNAPQPCLDTSKKAGEQAARKSERMKARIVELLRECPMTLFEVALKMNVPDHTISGRFTDLAKDQIIKRTGRRRVKPESGCECEEWSLV